MEAPFVSYLIGDIGGTNVSLILKKVDKARHIEMIGKPVDLKAADFPSFEGCIMSFLKAFEGKPEYPKFACMGIAGPVGQKIQITNAKWPVFDVDEAKTKLKLQGLFMLNDFEANGYGVLAMAKTDYTVVNDCPVNMLKPKALIGTGTGLGECIVTRGSKDENYVVFPCEGGHVDFAPRSKKEFSFMEFVKAKTKVKRVSYERCCCGLAIPLMFDFLHKYLAKKHPAEISGSKIFGTVQDKLRKLYELMDKDQDNPEINTIIDDLNKNYIVPNGLSKADYLCKETLEMFASLYGAEAGNLALKTLPYGGIYLLSSLS